MSKYFVPVFALLLFFSTASFAQTRAELEKKKSGVQKEIGSLQKELENTQKNKNATLQQVNALKKKIAERENLIGGYAAQIQNLDKGISQTKQQLGTRQSNLRDLQARYAKMVLYNYRHASATGGLMFVLSANTFNEAFQRVRYLRRYAEYRRTQSEEIRVAILQLSEKQTQLLTFRSQKEMELQQEETQKQKLAREKSEQDKLVKNMSAKEKKIKSDLATKKKEQERLNKKIEEAIRREIAAATKASAKSGGSSSTKGSTKASTSAVLTMTPEAKALSSSFAANQGKFPWPVEKGSVSESFGTHAHPELKGVTTKNNGVDIRTAKGAAVRAVFKGKVVSIVNNPLYHKGVIVRHGEYFTVYTNLATVNVKVGDEITTKQTIGTVHTDADSGQSTVHFELWKGTVFLNPASWLAGN
ncbi:MAG TPA: peptidoglycan DD-metalloendopeptidase family protein [Chitinophagales bacterium]|nr:peptidoglycan DD-metalloendopeptidase family protein [Chitinophagales bacterium]